MTTSAFADLLINETFEPGTVEMTKIPDVLNDWATDCGVVLKFVSANPVHFVKYRTRGYRALHWDEVPPHIQSAVRGFVEPPERNHGELRMSDALIAVTSQRNEEAWHRMERERGLQLLGQTTLSTDQAEIDEKINSRMPGGRKVIHLEPLPQSSNTPMDHVFGGRHPGVQSEFSAEQIEELKRRREEIPD